MFEEHTVPKLNFEDFRLADGGGIPGGVDGRYRPTIFINSKVMNKQDRRQGRFYDENGIADCRTDSIQARAI